MKKTSFVAILILVVFALSACGTNTTTTATPISTAPALDTLVAEGVLQPVNSLDQSFSVPGQIEKVYVNDGEIVKAGQALAKLNDSPDVELALARAEQEVLSAQQALDNLKAQAYLALAQSNLAVLTAQTAVNDAQTAFDSEKSDENQAKLDKAAADLQLAKAHQEALANNAGIDPDASAAAEARLSSAQAALASAKAALESLTLKASLDGTVIDSTAQVGQRVSAGSPVMTLADETQWVVKTDNLTEINVADISLGQKVQIILDALPDTTLNGEVVHINARYEEKRGDVTYTVTIKVLDTDPRLRWGMTAAVKFVR